MLYREIIAACPQIHTKHINTLCGQNVELLNVKLTVHIVTTGLQSVNLIRNGVRATSTHILIIHKFLPLFSVFSIAEFTDHTKIIKELVA